MSHTKCGRVWHKVATEGKAKKYGRHTATTVCGIPVVGFRTPFIVDSPTDNDQNCRTCTDNKQVNKTSKKLHFP